MKVPLTSAFLILVASVLLVDGGNQIQAQAPAGKPEFTKVEQTLKDIPRDLMLALRPGPGMSDAASKATVIVRKTAEGKLAEFKMEVYEIEKFQRKAEPNVDRYHLKAQVEPLKEGVTTFQVYLVATADIADHPKLEKIKRGSRVTVSGVIFGIDVSGRQNLDLHIDIADAKLK